MINGTPQDFLEIVYNGENIEFLFRGKTYWYQGYSKNGIAHMEIMQHTPEFNCTWEYEDPDWLKCFEAFQKAPIFEGKTFWEVEHEIEWLD